MQQIERDERVSAAGLMASKALRPFISPQHHKLKPGLAYPYTEKLITLRNVFAQLGLDGQEIDEALEEGHQVVVETMEEIRQKEINSQCL